MATLPSGPRSRPRAENDVYTALLLISSLVALAATIYVGARAAQLFGTWLPPAGG